MGLLEAGRSFPSSRRRALGRGALPAALCVASDPPLVRRGRGLYCSDCVVCDHATQLGTLQFSSVGQSCPTFWDPMDCSTQASLSITNSRSLLKLMSIQLVMPSNHLILCHPLPHLSSVFPSIRVFSSESVLLITWLKYWTFIFSISPFN